MKHSTDNSAKAVNGETLSSINFGQIEKTLYGLVCCLCCLIIVTASGGCDLMKYYSNNKRERESPET